MTNFSNLYWILFFPPKKVCSLEIGLSSYLKLCWELMPSEIAFTLILCLYTSENNENDHPISCLWKKGSPDTSRKPKPALMLGNIFSNINQRKGFSDSFSGNVAHWSILQSSLAQKACCTFRREYILYNQTRSRNCDMVVQKVMERVHKARWYTICCLERNRIWWSLPRLLFPSRKPGTPQPNLCKPIHSFAAQYQGHGFSHRMAVAHKVSILLFHQKLRLKPRGT